MKTLLLLLVSISAHAATWKATVIYPDNEEKVYVVEDSRLELKIPKLKASCSISEISRDKDSRGVPLEKRGIFCFVGGVLFKTRVILMTGGISDGQTLHMIQENGKKVDLYRISLDAKE